MKDDLPLNERTTCQRRLPCAQPTPGGYIDEVPFEGLRACSPFQGITLRSPTAHTEESTRLRYLKTNPAFGVEHVERATRAATLKDTKPRTKRRDRQGDAPEMRVVGIDFNPGPDAEERLRRLFIILLKLADDELPLPRAESLADRSSEEDG